jgi:hypothetical protein
MDATGKTLGEPPGRKVAQIRDYMKVVQEYLDLKPKAEKGDANAKVEHFIRAIQVGEYKDLQSADKYLKTLSKVSKEQKEKIDTLFVDLELSDALKPLRENRDRSKAKELQDEAVKACVALHKKGKSPSSDRNFGDFHSFLLIHAEQEKDIPLFEASLKKLEERFPEATRFFEGKQKVLEKMKAEKADKAEK